MGMHQNRYIFLVTFLLIFCGSARAQYTTTDQKSGMKATAHLEGFSSINITQKEGSNSPQDVQALVVSGDVLCLITDAVDRARKIQSATFKEKDIVYDVFTTSNPSMLKFSGMLVIRISMPELGKIKETSCESFFYPGVQWRVALPIRIKDDLYEMDLKPGRYRILEGVRFELLPD
jgi:hypothetical protein